MVIGGSILALIGGGSSGMIGLLHIVGDGRYVMQSEYNAETVLRNARSESVTRDLATIANNVDWLVRMEAKRQDRGQ
jgi:hypothetical protein